jgi:hypothetical protein
VAFEYFFRRDSPADKRMLADMLLNKDYLSDRREDPHSDMQATYTYLYIH